MCYCKYWTDKALCIQDNVKMRRCRRSLCTHQRIFVDLRIEMEHLWIQRYDVVFADLVRFLVVQLEQEISFSHPHIQRGAGEPHRFLNYTV